MPTIDDVDVEALSDGDLAVFGADLGVAFLEALRTKNRLAIASGTLDAEREAVVSAYEAAPAHGPAFVAAKAALDDLIARLAVHDEAWTEAVAEFGRLALLRDRAMLEASKRRAANAEADRAHAEARAGLRAVRDAELRKLATGTRAIERIGRLEGDVADLQVFTAPLTKGIRVTKRDGRGRITALTRPAAG